MVYIILDLDSGNYVSTYATEGDALADVRESAERFGRGEVVSWALARREDDDRLTAIAEGEALIDRAFGMSATRQPSP
jgi:hypothetical protein